VTIAPEYLPALDRTLELKADVASTNSPPPEAIGLGKDLEERMRMLRNPSLGSEGLGWGRAPPSKLGGLSYHHLPPWHHSPPRLNLGGVSPMPCIILHTEEAQSGAPASRCPSATAPGWWSRPPPSNLARVAEIRRLVTVWPCWIGATDRAANVSYFMKFVDWWTSTCRPSS
jgi:hypothetical protein